MRRACEPLLRELLTLFPAVAIIGPRQCGKTTLLGTLPKAWTRIDLERVADYQAVARDPDLFLRLHPDLVAFDEAQMLPGLFAALRVAIDQHRDRPGRFVLTGSSSPDLIRSVSDSLAGRIGLIELAPFSLAETHPKAGPGLVELVARRDTSPGDLVHGLALRCSVKEAHEYWFRGGYPEPWVKRSERFTRLWMDNYVRTYLYRDVGRLFPGVDQDRFGLLVHLLAGLSGTILNLAEMARSLGVSQPTVSRYIEIAHGTFLWRRIPAFSRQAKKRIARRPKGYLRDTGLLHHLLHIADPEALATHPLRRASWEGCVVEELLRGFAALGIACEPFHYRTAGGAEVDLVLEGEFGLVPVEIKCTQAVRERELGPLRDFVQEHRCRMGVVINNDETPRLYDDKLVGVPFSWT